MKRRSSIYSKIDSVFKEDWRSTDEILEEFEGEDEERWIYDVAYEEL